MTPSRDLRPLSIVAALLAILVLTAPAQAAFSGGVQPGQRAFISVMNGGQVVPPSISNAFGVGFLTFDNITKRLCYSISFSGLQGTESEAHLHGAPVGQTDVVFFDLPLGSPKMGCVGPLSPKQEKLLRRGGLYINIHTDLFVAGELRGQVVPVPTVH